MANAVAWALFALGVGHIVYGVIAYRTPLAEAVAGGFIGAFEGSDARRTAFWFVLAGPLLMLAGHMAVYAAAHADLALLKLIGRYTVAISAAGLLAFPKSPFLLALPVSALLLAVGYGWFA